MGNKQTWYTYTLSEIKDRLDTNLYKGLNVDEVLKRQEKYGPNSITDNEKSGVFSVIYAQFKSPLVFILLGAGVVTLFLHEYIDFTVIAIALLINVVVGTIQEERAGKAFSILSKSQKKKAIVRRGGHRVIVPTEELVVGDIIILESGMYVPADARVIDETELTVNESVLTGEWVDVSKNTEDIKNKVPITNQLNMVWMGTLATGGNAEAVVVKIGDDTEIGSIAQDIAMSPQIKTPLKRGIAKLARYLTYIILIALVIIFALGILRGEALSDMFLIAIAITVAAIPSGLPAAVTVVLAIGMESILREMDSYETFLQQKLLVAQPQL